MSKRTRGGWEGASTENCARPLGAAAAFMKFIVTITTSLKKWIPAIRDLASNTGYRSNTNRANDDGIGIKRNEAAA
jgi:hypothetical protein